MRGRARRIRPRSAALNILLAAGLIASVPAVATAAYVPPYVSVGTDPISVQISPNGTFAYVTNGADNTVSVIDTASRTVTGTINVGTHPHGVVFSPDSRTAYIANHGDLHKDEGSVSVIDTATRAVRNVSVAPLAAPSAVAVAPDGKKAYVVGFNYLSVIDTATNVAQAVDIGRSHATDVKVTPDGSRVYIADFASGSVVVVSTATNGVIATVPLPPVPTSSPSRLMACACTSPATRATRCT